MSRILPQQYLSTPAFRRNHGVLPPRQQGIALVVALILLLVITLVGLAAVSGTLLQQKMSSSFYDRELAFQSTEAAMRQAGTAIQTAVASATAPAGYPDCSPSSGNKCLANPFDESTVPTIYTVSSGSFNPGSIAAGQPQYIVQYMGRFQTPNQTARQISNTSYGSGNVNLRCADFYRITARSGDPASTGGRAQVTLQSFFMANPAPPPCP